MIKFYSGGGKSWKIVGKTANIRQTGFLEKHTNAEEKTQNMRYKRRFYINF